jgi:hypothetical protein
MLQAGLDPSRRIPEDRDFLAFVERTRPVVYVDFQRLIPTTHKLAEAISLGMRVLFLESAQIWAAWGQRSSSAGASIQ